jgi:hypothetical protein
MNRQSIKTSAKAVIITGLSASALLLTLGITLPMLLKARLPDIIHQHTGRLVSIGDIQVQLLPLTATITDFNLQEANQQNFAAFAALHIEFNLWQSLTQTSVVIEQMQLDKPYLRIAQIDEGQFNFSDLISPASPNQTETPAFFPLVINQLHLTNGTLAYENLTSTPHITEQLTPIDLAMDHLTTRQDASSQLTLDAQLSSGGHLNWTGNFGIQPFFSNGQINIEHLKLETLPWQVLQAHQVQGDVQLAMDYQLNYANHKLDLKAAQTQLKVDAIQYETKDLKVKLDKLTHNAQLSVTAESDHWQLTVDKAHLDSGNLRVQQDKRVSKLASLNVQTNYEIVSAAKQLNVIAKQGTIAAQDVKIAQQNQTVLTLPSLQFNGVDFDLNRQQINATSVQAHRPALKAWLNRDGRLNVQTEPLKTINEPEKQPWQFAIDQFTLKNGVIDFEDQTLTKPFNFRIKPIDLTLNQISTQSASGTTVELNATLNQDGAIQVKGDLGLTPPNAQLNLAISHIDLTKYQAYFDRFIRLDVIDGLLAVNGQLKVNKGEQLDLKFTGNAQIAQFLTRDQRVNKDFVKWENLGLEGISLDVLGKRYTAETLSIDKPYARVTIRKDKTINFSGLLIEHNNPAEQATATPKPQDTVYCKLGAIKIKEGYSDFTDLSLILPFSAHIQGLNGGANGLSSEKNASFTVALKGNAYDLAPVDVTGTLSPFLGDYQVGINFKGLPMPLISPYMVQFAGYKVENGKISLGLVYKIHDKQLAATNDILIDQFELGEKVENPNAVSLPLKLAVALLKDSNGRIKFDVPITGSLENPQFSLGAIISDAIVNAIGKIIASPFNAIASLIGSQKDLSTISFNAGSAELSAPQLAKLADLAKALQQRPQLTLEIKGTAYLDQDWPAISDDALYDQLKIRHAEELNKKKGAVKIRPEYVVLTNEDYQRLLADLFIEKFPLLAEKSFFGTPQLKANQSGEFYAVAKQKLLEIINPEQARLEELAAHRAQAIAKYLYLNAGIPQERVYILNPIVKPVIDSVEINSILSLKT